ncbi:hypothetical protein NPIL_571751 [Nephila pilipes]|uniref:Uncharacterized protein n=1 Tax=Nephila pilipes TaxID=299642 RepID=A0A8X6PEI4_NEPPI|nr:hypothetical protein NPIL_571751 [Nephila pilipes]
MTRKRLFPPDNLSSPPEITSDFGSSVKASPFPNNDLILSPPKDISSPYQDDHFSKIESSVNFSVLETDLPLSNVSSSDSQKSRLTFLN